MASSATGAAKDSVVTAGSDPDDARGVFVGDNAVFPTPHYKLVARDNIRRRTVAERLQGSRKDGGRRSTCCGRTRWRWK